MERGHGNQLPRSAGESVIRQLPCLIESPFEPDSPEYWDPQAELEYEVEIPNDVHDRLLAIICKSIDPSRLRDFDNSYRFDLERAATEYGPSSSE